MPLLAAAALVGLLLPWSAWLGERRRGWPRWCSGTWPAAFDPRSRWMAVPVVAAGTALAAGAHAGGARENAALALRGLDRPGVAKELIVLMADPDRWIRYGAAEAVGESSLSDPSLALALHGALDDPEPMVRRSALHGLIALARRGQAQALPPARARIVALLRDDDAWTRLAAVHALGALGDPAVIPHLVTALADDGPQGNWELVSTAAAAALRRLGPDGERALDQAIATMPRQRIPRWRTIERQEPWPATMR